MARFLTLLIILTCCLNTYSQAYMPLNIESEEDYRARKSYTPSQSQTKQNWLLTCSFERKSDKQLCYTFDGAGNVYNYINNISGSYYVGDECGYKTYYVHIRWQHGGSQLAKVNFYERSDGFPNLYIKRSDGSYTKYRPRK